MSSDTPTINLQNEVIAQFEGYEKVFVGYFDSEGNGLDVDQTEWQLENEKWLEKVGIANVGWYAVNVKEDKWHEWENVKYHTSWDWLMPVVEQIRKGISFRTFEIDYQLFYEDKKASSIFHLYIYASRDTVHEAVHQFIQWYNQNKPNEPV